MRDSMKIEDKINHLKNNCISQCSFSRDGKFGAFLLKVIAIYQKHQTSNIDVF